MHKFYIIATMLIASPALADNASPYEDAAKIDISNLASMILAASICPNVQFSSDQVIPHLVGAALILRARASRKLIFPRLKPPLIK